MKIFLSLAALLMGGSLMASTSQTKAPTIKLVSEKVSSALTQDSDKSQWERSERRGGGRERRERSERRGGGRERRERRERGW